MKAAGYEHRQLDCRQTERRLACSGDSAIWPIEYRLALASLSSAAKRPNFARNTGRPPCEQADLGHARGASAHVLRRETWVPEFWSIRVRILIAPWRTAPRLSQQRLGDHPVGARRCRHRATKGIRALAYQPSEGTALTAQNRVRVAHLQRHHRGLLDSRPLPHPEDRGRYSSFRSVDVGKRPLR
jgi:hypothetical protein